MTKQIVDVIDAVEELSKVAIEKSKTADVNDGQVSYAYALGWFVTDISMLMAELNLTKKQQMVLVDRLDRLGRV